MFKGHTIIGKDNSWNLDDISSVKAVDKENRIGSGSTTELVNIFNYKMNNISITSREKDEEKDKGSHKF